MDFHLNLWSSEGGVGGRKKKIYGLENLETCLSS